MDDQSVMSSATLPISATSADQFTASSRPRPSALYYIDTATTATVASWTDAADRAAALGFDAILLSSPFATDGSSHEFNVTSHAVLRETLGGGAVDTALGHLASTAHANDLSVVLDVCMDRIAITAPLAEAHPDWFVHADDAAAFCFLSESDAAVDWWDDRFAAWQSVGIDGFRCDAAHRVPATVWARLIRAARSRNPTCLFIASTFGATPPAIAGLAGCGFDFALSSSCWWDGSAPWLADDLDRIGGIGHVATLAAPPGHTGPLANRAIGLAAFLGRLWVLNIEPVASQTEVITSANALRRHHRALFEGAARLVSPPFAPVAVFARIGAPDGGLLFALAPGIRSITATQIRAWLGESCGEIIRLPDAAAPSVDRENAFTTSAAGTLLLYTQPPRPVTRVASKAIPAKNAVKAPRIAIEAVSPAVESGRFPIKRIVGEQIVFEADLICDGHGKLAADLLWRAADETAWQRAPMALLANDRWTATLRLDRLGRHQVTIEAWIDRFGAFVDEITKKHAAGVDIALERVEGVALIEAAAHHATPPDREAATALLALLAATPEDQRLALLIDPVTVALMRTVEPRHSLLRLHPPLPVEAERTKAGFASWYEIFPRSQSGSETRHGHFDDVIAHLPRIHAMGFDILYFPPIHPIGHKNRKGRNNSLTPSETDPGSPYAIGGPDGGHCALHPELGSFDDFRRLLTAVADHGLELALDFAIQCAPDHPWLREHPEWFDWRPDGSIRYAENPPKKYEDIVNVDFYAEGAMPSLWIALRDVVAFWVKQGVRIFRVDNPHTKPLPFWEWMINDIRARNPEVMFLAEAFTTPKLMYRLAKLGFSQSYTYFTWRNTAAELREYFTELTTMAPREFFRPHLFVNTPDINPVFLQTSGRPGFLLRAALAATLSGLWGVYNGFELCESAALPGREEYLDSEKYQIRAWDHDRPGNIVSEITALNRMRRQNPALHSHLGITFLPCSNEHVLYFEKTNADRSNVILAAISLDPFNRQIAEIELPLWRFGLADDAALNAEDLARGVAFVWHGKHQIVSLDPHELPYCIWRVRA
ncbi:MAG: DUF3416 domain-containing protein [Acidiphilium sp.]|nr:DUF3416 domain-containing protein [Acidiphilium sp.]MDD4936140.1 DUF3416 domain-containing protein [Acidiphilium sp.]